MNNHHYHPQDAEPHIDRCPGAFLFVSSVPRMQHHGWSVLRSLSSHLCCVTAGETYKHVVFTGFYRMFGWAKLWKAKLDQKWTNGWFVAWVGSSCKQHHDDFLSPLWFSEPVYYGEPQKSPNVRSYSNRDRLLPILSFPLIAVPKKCRKVFPVGLYDEVTGYCYTASKSMLHIYIYNCTNNNNTVIIIMMIITIYDRLLFFWLLYPNMSHAISIIYIH